MTTRVAERRSHTRMAACYVASLHDARGRLIARGRTANISESGVLLVIRRGPGIPTGGEVLVDLLIPADPIAGTKRQVRYRCRVVRRQELANMVGLGLQFCQKIA